MKLYTKFDPALFTPIWGVWLRFEGEHSGGLDSSEPAISSGSAGVDLEGIVDIFYQSTSSHQIVTEPGVTIVSGELVCGSLKLFLNKSILLTGIECFFMRYKSRKWLVTDCQDRNFIKIWTGRCGS